MGLDSTRTKRWRLEFKGLLMCWNKNFVWQRPVMATYKEFKDVSKLSYYINSAVAVLGILISLILLCHSLYEWIWKDRIKNRDHDTPHVTFIIMCRCLSGVQRFWIWSLFNLFEDSQKNGLIKETLDFLAPTLTTKFSKWISFEFEVKTLAVRDEAKKSFV